MPLLRTKSPTTQTNATTQTSRNFQQGFRQSLRPDRPSVATETPIPLVFIFFAALTISYRDGHHNLNCAKLKQAKLKLKLNTQIVAVARPLDF